jgi:hypothetical protein
MESKLRLEPDQQATLAGSSGPALKLALQTLARYGEAFGAKRLVPIKSAHLAGTFGALTYKAYYLILRQLTAEGLKVKVPTTCNPMPGHDLNFLNRRLVFRRQEELMGRLAALGVTPNYSCVCYDSANVPQKGDALAWAESSAVQFANSVLGARTNRNSILIDICSAITGLTPEFGLLLDENRRARLLVKLDIQKMDAPALGFLLGRKAVNQAPVLEHYPFSRIELKNMGGAMAAAGAVALFHVEGLTPEAPDIRTACQGEPERTIVIGQRDLDELRAKNARPDLVVFGCPQMTFEEAAALAERFAGKRARVPAWFCLIPEARERFITSEHYARVAAAGVTVNSLCPLAALTVQLRRQQVLTPSGKLYYYLAGASYGNQDDCLSACGVGA